MRRLGLVAEHEVDRGREILEGRIWGGGLAGRTRTGANWAPMRARHPISCKVSRLISDAHIGKLRLAGGHVART